MLQLLWYMIERLGDIVQRTAVLVYRQEVMHVLNEILLAFSDHLRSVDVSFSSTLLLFLTLLI